MLGISATLPSLHPFLADGGFPQVPPKLKPKWDTHFAPSADVISFHISRDKESFRCGLIVAQM